ncbi:unnamed protein product [Prorocentrum cordatum]|uniref:C3H1-type domain-containing protein n=1 Tax=Prorocentrum cordatum TaxID=2364126 RepID=A0ABN9RGW0_9DINO|nr:unnamed protein product [Polarella glacialis]
MASLLEPFGVAARGRRELPGQPPMKFAVKDKDKRKEKDAGKGSERFCPNFNRDSGCNHGANCRQKHRRLAASDGKCFNGGSTKHRNEECSTEAAAAQAARAEVSAHLPGPMGMGAAPEGSLAQVSDELAFWEAGPSAKTISIAKAGARSAKLLLADTGATHELRGVPHLAAVRGARDQLRTATGKVEAQMQQDIVYVTGEDIQRPFPLSSYIEENAEILRQERRKMMRARFRAEMATLARGLRAMATARPAEAAPHPALREHAENGHVKFDESCGLCRGASSRMRPHFRHDASTRPGGQLSSRSVRATSAWPLALKAARGPGEKKAIHFLLAAFSVTTDDELALKRRREEGASAGAERTPEGQAASAGEDADAVAAVPEVPPLLLESAPTAHPALRGLMARAAEAFGVSARPAGVEAQGAPGEGQPVGPDIPGEASGDNPAPPILVEGSGLEAEDEDGSAARPKSRTWYCVVPLERRRHGEGIAALNTVIASIRKEFEGADVVYRIHGDRASEVTSEKVQHYFDERHIAVTSTPGYEPNANKRAEKGVGLI